MYNERMPRVGDEFLRQLLQALADVAPEPLYPAHYSKDRNIDREELEAGFDELRRRGLVKLTDWVKNKGQGLALTDAGRQALASGSLTPAPVEEASERPSEAHEFERGEIVRRALIEAPRPYVSWTLVVANLVIFFAGAIYAGIAGYGAGDYLVNEGDSATVVRNLGGLSRRDVLPTRDERPQFERLIIAGFLHFGLLHLAMNMYFLATLAGLVEAMWGHVRFVVIYFVAEIVSSCVVMMIGPADGASTVYVTAGASGSVFGVFAALVVWFSMNREYLPEHAAQDFSRTIGINLMLMVAVNFVGSVSWQGHLGGAIGGLLAALLLHVQRFHPVFAVRVLALVALPIVPIGFFVGMLWHAGWISV